jgi:hypothetical protein
MEEGRVRAAKCILWTVASLTVAACATRPGQRDGVAHVNPASVAASPAEWDGREVEMVGLLVWEFENFALYQSYGAYCRGGERTAIYVDWRNWAGVTRGDNRRGVMVRGVFRNKVGVKQPDGSILLSNAASGPGPLDPGHVVRWLSPPAKPCPRALP